MLEVDKQSKALFAMVAFGFGEVFGGLAGGYIIDSCGSKVASLVNVLIVIVMISVTLVAIFVLEYNVISFIMCFMWGVQDGALNVHTF